MFETFDELKKHLANCILRADGFDEEAAQVEAAKDQEQLANAIQEFIDTPNPDPMQWLIEAICSDLQRDWVR